MGQTHSGAAAVLHDILNKPTADLEPSTGLLETVSAMAKPCELTELLLSLYKDDQTVNACAARSFRHPLGFNKLTLIDALPLYMLRIHAWWPDSGIAVDHVHNHRFDFISSVVCGGYDMEVYKQDYIGSPMVEYRESVSPELGWSLNHIGMTRLRPLTTIRLQQGTSYTLSAESLHRVTAQPAIPSVTLFLQTTISRSTTQVFVSPGGPTPIRTPKEPMTSDAYRLQLEAILAELTP